MLKTFLAIFRAFSRTERIAFAAAATLAVIALAVLGGLAIERTTVVAPAAGGEYVEGIVGQPTFVNPVLASTDIDRALVRLTFANIPELAASTDVSPDGRTWKVRLKENLRWSDEQKITSDDVIFTVERLQDPETRSPLFSSWQGVSVSRLSELELQFNLANPYPFFTENLNGLFPIPKHLFADTPLANWRLSDYILRPVGSGPFAFDAYNKQPSGFIDTYRLIANPRFAAGAPYLAHFTARFFPKLEEVIAGFNTGAVDGIAGLAPEALAEVNRSYASWSFTIPSYYAVFLNQNQNLALKDPAVRAALALATDRTRITQSVFAGRATITTGPTAAAAPDNVYDPDRAGALLDAAGWQKTDSGRREKKLKSAVLPLDLELTVPAIPFLEKTAEELTRTWSALGIAVRLRTLPPNEIADGIIRNRDYQTLLFGNFLNPPGDLYSFWHSNERFYPGLNLALYSNKSVDALLEGVRRDFNAESRGEKLAEIGRSIAADAPAVFLYAPDYLMITSKDLRGVEAGAIAEPSDRFRTVSRWHVKTTRVFK